MYDDGSDNDYYKMT